MSKFLREDNFKYVKKHEIDYGRIKTIQFIEKVHKFKEEIKLKNKLKELKQKKLQKNGEINWNLRSKEELYQSKFKRNPFDLKENSANQFNFQKHKEQIEFADRNMSKNRLNHALNQIALHFVKVKSKLNLNKDIFKEIKNAINNNIKKTKTITKKKSLFVKTSTSLNFYDENNYYNKNKKEDKKKNDDNNNDNNLHYFLNDNNSSSFSNDEDNKLYEKQNSNKKKLLKSNLILKVVPPTHGKNYYFIKKLGKYPHSAAHTRVDTDYTTNFNSNNNKNKVYNNYNYFNNKKLKIKNNPFHTTDINDFIRDYHKINNELNKEKKCFIKRKFHDYDEIEEMMNIRKELKLFKLKDKYINSNLSKPKKNLKLNNKNKLFNTIYSYCKNHEIDYI